MADEQAEREGGLEPQPGEFRAGDPVGRYRVERVMGRGGMGTVYKAFDATTNRFVAVKVLAPGLSEAIRSRFLAEGEAQAKIRHEHVMPVYDRGWLPDERPYFVMELVYEPLTLAEISHVLERGVVAPRLSRIRHWSDPRKLLEEVILPVADGLDRANREYRTIHRDVKPDNVLIDIRTRRPYLIDFGICHRLGETVDAKKIVGTPRFLSPEQAGGRVHERTDVFGLGALLHFVVTGEPPVAGASSMTREERVRRIAALGKAEEEAEAKGDTSRVIEMSSRRAALEDSTFRTIEDMLRDAREGIYLPLPTTVPAGLKAIITKAMAHSPEARYVSVGDVAEDLRAWLAGGKVHALSEQAATTAAVDLARRALRDNLVRIGLVTAGVVVGVIVGSFLGRTLNPPPPPGLEHAAEDLKALEGFVPDPAAGALDGAVEWDLVQTRLAGVEARLARAPKATEEAARLARLRTRFAPPTPTFRAARGGTWFLQDLARNRQTGLAPGPVPLPPGLYRIVSEDGRPVSPALVAPASLETFAPSTFPTWLAYVPPGPTPVAKDGTVKPFLAALREVTNLEWRDWLDEMSEEERARHVPATDFVRIAGEGRFGPLPGRGRLPVTGVRPEDALAYAAWRSEVEERPLRLPTAAEWRRIALAVAEPAPSVFRDPPEMLVAPDGAFGVAGRGDGGGLIPSDGSLSRVEPLAPGESAVGVGIRLIQPLDN